MNTLLLILAFLGFSSVPIAKMPACAKWLGQTQNAFEGLKNRTRRITADQNLNVGHRSLDALITQLSDDQPTVYHRPLTVALGPLFGELKPYGPMDFLRPSDFDSELQSLITQILSEAQNINRVQPALDAQIRQIRNERAEALWRFRSKKARLEGAISDSVIAYWRDQANIEAQARGSSGYLVEVGAWVLTLNSGRRKILPLFSGQTARAHCELEVYEPLHAFLLTMGPREHIRVAQFFHNHPMGPPVLSMDDFRSTDALAKHLPQIGEFHTYAIATVNGPVQIGHYGVRR